MKETLKNYGVRRSVHLRSGEQKVITRIKRLIREETGLQAKDSVAIRYALHRAVSAPVDRRAIQKAAPYGGKYAVLWDDDDGDTEQKVGTMTVYLPKKDQQEFRAYKSRLQAANLERAITSSLAMRAALHVAIEGEEGYAAIGLNPPE